jgi:hypothetical protein
VTAGKTSGEGIRYDSRVNEIFVPPSLEKGRVFLPVKRGKGDSMICECCKRNMMEGYVPSIGLWWIPKAGEHGKWDDAYKKKGERAGSLKMLNSKQTPAYYCVHCNRIVIQCGNE